MNTLLNNWRIGADLMVKEAADRVGVTSAMWSRWETGSRRIPPSRVLEIERITGVSRHALCPEVFGPEREAVE